jgi:hypothetical protein
MRGETLVHCCWQFAVGAIFVSEFCWELACRGRCSPSSALRSASRLAPPADGNALHRRLCEGTCRAWNVQTKRLVGGSGNGCRQARIRLGATIHSDLRRRTLTLAGGCPAAGPCQGRGVGPRRGIAAQSLGYRTAPGASRYRDGEAVNDLNVGDSVRWQIIPATQGTSNATITHVMIKPTDIGLTTNRRAYSIKLVGRAEDWMPRVASSPIPMTCAPPGAPTARHGGAREQAAAAAVKPDVLSISTSTIRSPATCKRRCKSRPVESGGVVLPRGGVITGHWLR